MYRIKHIPRDSMVVIYKKMAMMMNVKISILPLHLDLFYYLYIFCMPGMERKEDKETHRSSSSFCGNGNGMSML